MPQQELNLLQLATARVAQLRTGSPQVMRRNMLQTRSLAATLDYVPHHILRDAFSPYFSRSRNSSKDSSLRDLGCHYPLIECRFDPLRNGHGADVPALADQIHHRPVPLAHLHLIHFQAHQFRSAEATSEQHGQHRIVSLCTHAIATGVFEHLGTLLHTQPVAGAKPELLDSFHSTDACGQFGTQQARVGSLVRQATHGCELLVDGVGGQMPRFQVHAVAHDYDPVQCESRFGAVPGNELIDGVFIDAARGWRAETVEHCQSAMIQIRQPKHSATIVRLDSVFAHGDGLPCRSIWDDGGRLDVAKWVALRFGPGVLSAMA